MLSTKKRTMKVTNAHSLKRLVVLLILAASVAAFANPAAAYVPDGIIPTWGCYPNAVPNPYATPDPSGFTPDRSGLILVYGNWKPQSSGQRSAYIIWGCYANINASNPDFYGLPEDLYSFTPDVSSFTPDVSSFTPDPSGFTPPRDFRDFDIAFAVALDDGSLRFITWVG